MENSVETTQTKTTDPLAIICFATGIGGLAIFPEVFVPIGFIAGIISYYRLKENPNLKGKGLRITGAILNLINILAIMYKHELGPFS